MGGGGGDSGCSCSCGPGGELPSPGCSAETSMGGCVGSHHDSSGSLNENSDGTGGNLTTCFFCVCSPFLFPVPGASFRFPACCPVWRSPSLSVQPSQTQPDWTASPGLSRSTKRVPKQHKPAHGDFMKSGYFLSAAASLFFAAVRS